VRRCEWLSFMPKIGFLPHTSQTDDIGTHLGRELANGPIGTGAARRSENRRNNRVRLAPAPAGTSAVRPVRN
jgi:hypothetical protein